LLSAGFPAAHLLYPYHYCINIPLATERHLPGGSSRSENSLSSLAISPNPPTSSSKTRRPTKPGFLHQYSTSRCLWNSPTCGSKTQYLG
jgi:hypothetical protein